eukprot:6996673-Pyramimonas_sp.AAC.1
MPVVVMLCVMTTVGGVESNRKVMRPEAVLSLPAVSVATAPATSTYSSASSVSGTSPTVAPVREARDKVGGGARVQREVRLHELALRDVLREGGRHRDRVRVRLLRRQRQYVRVGARPVRQRHRRLRGVKDDAERVGHLVDVRGGVLRRRKRHYQLDGPLAAGHQVQGPHRRPRRRRERPAVHRHRPGEHQVRHREVRDVLAKGDGEGDGRHVRLRREAVADVADALVRARRVQVHRRVRGVKQKGERVGHHRRVARAVVRRPVVRVHYHLYHRIPTRFNARGLFLKTKAHLKLNRNRTFRLQKAYSPYAVSPLTYTKRYVRFTYVALRVRQHLDVEVRRLRVPPGVGAVGDAQPSVVDQNLPAVARVLHAVVVQRRGRGVVHLDGDQVRGVGDAGCVRHARGVLAVLRDGELEGVAGESVAVKVRGRHVERVRAGVGVVAGEHHRALHLLAV